MVKKSIREVKEDILKFKCVTPWENVKKGDMLHIPPIASLLRRDIIVIDKGADELTYKRIDDGDATKPQNLHRTSIFSKFIVKRKKF